jgi:hypothetical protein
MHHHSVVFWCVTEKNTRTTSIQHRINTLYDRNSNNLINSSELLAGLAFVVTKKIK